MIIDLFEIMIIAILIVTAVKIAKTFIVIIVTSAMTAERVRANTNNNNREIS